MRALSMLAKATLPTWIVDLIRDIKRIIRKARANHRISLRNRDVIVRLLGGHSELYVELGGSQKKSGWVTIDLSPTADVVHDITLGIPFPDNSVDFIYSSHFFEHLYKRQVDFVLSECFRILKSGGKFSICVPNAAIYIDGYNHAEPFDLKKFIVFQPANRIDSKIDIVNYMAYLNGDHRNMFDQESLSVMLTKVGFQRVCKREFDSAFDKAERDYESIYAEGTKP